MPSLGVYAELSRPLNCLLAAVAVAVGAFAAGSDASWWPVAAASMAGLLGVAGANALNDAGDARLDQRAHPGRVVARGAATHHDARWFGATLLVAAIIAAALAGVWVVVLAAILAFNILWYESAGKSSWFWGHLLVAVNAGALFALGGLAAIASPGFAGSFDAGTLMDARLRGPWVMAALAALLNLARELYKSLEDAPADHGHRRTLATEAPAGARGLAAVTTWTSIPLAFAPFAVGWFDAVYALTLVPVALLLLTIPLLGSNTRSRAALKVAMVLGLVPFISTVLL